jgi:hypothetical protein
MRTDEDILDVVVDGTGGIGALAPADIKSIHASNESAAVLAARFKTTLASIRDVWLGKIRPQLAGGEPDRRPPAQSLTEETVLAIWQAEGPTRAVAERFGVTTDVVWSIRSGQAWLGVTGGPSSGYRHTKKLTQEEIIYVYNCNDMRADLARRMGVSESLVSRIRSGQLHADITGAVPGMQPPRLRPVQDQSRPRPHRCPPPSARRTCSPQLTDKQALEVYVSAERGDLLARKFGVSTTTISHIRRGLIFTHATRGCVRIAATR